MTSVTPKHRPYVRFGLVPLVAALGAASTAAADEPTTLYALDEDFEYMQGCFHQPGEWHQCLCPISWAQEFEGTFGLTAMPGDPGFDTYAISDIDWVVSLNYDLEITGSGIYEIGTDAGGNPVHRMTLELYFDGYGPVWYKSGLVCGGDDDFPPRITIPISDGFYCPGRRITVGASAVELSPADVAPPGGDGIVGVLDFLAVVADWGLPGPRPTDIDGSGTVDLGDILILLGDWTT
ncbi:MAG: hypothetical protein ACYTF4_11010 [Planctomycetota bacterium]|jgi:hypothetical protein